MAPPDEGDLITKAVPSARMFLTAAEAARAAKLIRFFEQDLSEQQRKALSDFSDLVEAAITAGEFEEVKEGDFGVNIGAVEVIQVEPPEDVKLWGAPLLPSKDDCETMVILLTFLRTRDFKVNDALLMLKNCVLWRKMHGVEKILEEDFGPGFNALAFNYGVDKKKQPVQYNVLGALQDEALYQSVFEDPSRTLRWRVQLVEKLFSDSLGFYDGSPHCMLQVVDLQNAPLHKKKVRSLISQAVRLFSENYPELISQIVFINSPLYFQGIPTLLNPFLTERMKHKYTNTRCLFKFMAPDNIPVQYGGLNKANDPDFKDLGRPRVAEIILQAGEKTTVEFPVPGVGYLAVWEFTSGVVYKVEFVPDGNYTIILEKREANFQPASSSSFTTPGPGKLVFSLDNSTFKQEKMVGAYRFILKATPAVRVSEIKGRVACSHAEHASRPFPEGRIQPLFGDEGGLYYPSDSEFEMCFQKFGATRKEEEIFWRVYGPKEEYHTSYGPEICVKKIPDELYECIVASLAYLRGNHPELNGEGLTYA